MEPVLSEQQRLLRDTASRLAASAGGPRRARALRDAGAEIDAEAWHAIAAAGWLGAIVGEAQGGLGLATLDLVLAIEENGKQLLMVPLAEATAAALAIAQAGRQTSPHATLADALAGRWLIVPAMSNEAWTFAGGAGAAPGMRIAAQGPSLDGAVDHVPFAAPADFLLVDATTASGAHALILLPRTTLDVVSRRNVDGSTSSSVGARSVCLDPACFLARGEDAARIATRTQELLVLLASVELLGVAQAAHDMTSEYLKLRKQFGKPIGSFQALQHRMVDCLVDLELSRSLLYRVVAAWDRHEAHPAMVSACKARLSRGALATVRLAVQLHGAMGYTDEHDIGLYYKRAVTLAAKYGNEVTQTDRFSALTLPDHARRG